MAEKASEHPSFSRSGPGTVGAGAWGIPGRKRKKKKKKKKRLYEKMTFEEKMKRRKKMMREALAD